MDPNQRELHRIPDTNLQQLSVPDLQHLVRKLESEKLGLASDHAAMMKEINKRMHVHLLEIRGLKEVNQRLQDDGQELRDLCVFLDDDRQKSRKLAREWQRFGRYTSSVMKSEVSAYQEKLHELEVRQNGLAQENLELKELCLYLDEERRSNSKNLNTSDGRDQGDGSSISSLTNERLDEVTVDGETTTSSPTVKTTGRDNDGNKVTPARSTINDYVCMRSDGVSDHTTQYIQHLENHIKTLEDQLTQMDVRIPSRDWASPSKDDPMSTSSDSGRSTKSPSKPEAVVHAMKSLDARERLEQISEGHYDEGLNEMEKAVLRQMCQVAKRKLEKDPSPDKPTTQRPPPVLEALSPRHDINNTAPTSGGHVESTKLASSNATEERHLPAEYYTGWARISTHQEGTRQPPPRNGPAAAVQRDTLYTDNGLTYSQQQNGMTYPKSASTVERANRREFQGHQRATGHPEFPGQRAGPLEYQEQRAGPPEYSGQRAGPPEYSGQRAGPPEFQGPQRTIPPDFQGQQRAGLQDYQGQQRTGQPEYQGHQRTGALEHQGQRTGPPEYAAPSRYVSNPSQSTTNRGYQQTDRRQQGPRQ